MKVTQMAQVGRRVGGLGYKSDAEKSIFLREIDNADRICDADLNLKITDDHFSSLSASLNHLLSAQYL